MNQTLFLIISWVYLIYSFSMVLKCCVQNYLCTFYVYDVSASARIAHFLSMQIVL